LRHGQAGRDDQLRFPTTVGRASVEARHQPNGGYLRQRNGRNLTSMMDLRTPQAVATRSSGYLLVAILVAQVLLAGLASAEALQKYRGWEKSPEALFLTSEEKSEWKGVRTDAAAERFIAEYMKRRGPRFRSELTRRIEMADRYLSSGATRGSSTLRGKVMILCGPPSRIEQSGGVGLAPSENPMLTSVYTNVGPLGSRPSPPRASAIVYELRYSGREVRERLGRDELVIKLEIDPAGIERFVNEKMAKDFEAVANQIAGWSIAPSSEIVVRMANFH
jgi:GWxTD domain-containing protein